MKPDELLLLNLITSVNKARNFYLEAIHAAKTADYEICNELMRKGNEMYADGHRIHQKLIQLEADGEKHEFSVLLTHAQDQLISAECFKIICDEFISVYKRLDNLKEN